MRVGLGVIGSKRAADRFFDWAADEFGRCPHSVRRLDTRPFLTPTTRNENMTTNRILRFVSPDQKVFDLAARNSTP